MKHLILTIFILVGAVSHNTDVYQIRPNLSEDDLKRLYVEMLLRFARYAEKQWHVSTFDKEAGYWGNGISDGNEGIRAVANTALAYAVLIRHTNRLNLEQKKVYTERTLAGIRYAVGSHLTGDHKCVDGKKWGNSWQSAMWAGNIGFAAWILWDRMDEGLRSSVRRVVAYEADRFLGKKPRGNRWSDTKAEELGWDQICISLAANMLAGHPHVPQWREKSVEWMMNVLSVPKDAKDNRVVDGRQVREWVSTVNVHPDFTLENHGFFHPTYTMVSPAEVGQGAFMYAYAGNPIPEAAGHHLLENWRLLQHFMQPCGYWIYPQGMDWALNSDGHIHYLAWLATYARDPIAAGMEKRVAQYMAGHQLIHEGERFAGPASRLGFAREAITAERLAYSYLYHQVLGVPPEGKTIEQIRAVLNGIHRYPFADIMTHRTDSKFVSFSWKNQIMGLVVPIGAHETNPYFTTPITDGFIGGFSIRGVAGERPIVVNRTWRKFDAGFETAGVLLLNGGRLRQELRFVSIGEKTVVYTDRVVALSDLTVESERGVPIGIENDEFTGDRRILYNENGADVVSGANSQRLIVIPGKWANVDGRLGIVSVLGSGLAYWDQGSYNRDGAREDFLFGAYTDKPRTVKAGQEVARRAVVLFTEISPEETRRLAESVEVLEKEGSEILRFELPEGGKYEVDLR